ncbi:hypothetical protein JTE90_009466 [Oedothorax gibbosus]|uniref:Protein FAM133B n=1 Tax=Oedothorax gibbosus TaxID=931172 RepID=A0AAV6VRY3_9ARAC|nr:hypothetical protein JTE90_009466 [Oedothorax gibbosus]
MGKRDTRYAYMNPIAMARARGPVSSGGPSMRDYMNRERPSWEEVKEILRKKKQGSSTLAAWEDRMNEKFRKELKRNREKLLKENSSDKKKLKKKRSSSSSPRLSENTSEKSAHSSKHKHKKSKRKRDHSDKEEDCLDSVSTKLAKKNKHKKEK